MNRIVIKKKRFQRRRLGIKRKIKAHPGKMRLCVFRSSKHFYAQIIDDLNSHTLVAASSLDKDFPEMKNSGNRESAKQVGRLIAERAVAKGIKKVVFDRNGYLYHGKVKEFAGSAREHGLEF